MTTAADAILTALRAALPVDVSVYDSLVPGIPTARYVVAYVPSGLRVCSTVDGISNDVHLQFQTTSVASSGTPSYSAATCRWLAAAVRDTLTDLVIDDVTGWASAQIRHDGSQSPRIDEQTPDKKVYATDQFSLATVRVS